MAHAILTAAILNIWETYLLKKKKKHIWETWRKADKITRNIKNWSTQMGTQRLLGSNRKDKKKNRKDLKYPLAKWQWHYAQNREEWEFPKIKLGIGHSITTHQPNKRPKTF